MNGSSLSLLNIMVMFADVKGHRINLGILLQMA